MVMVLLIVLATVVVGGGVFALLGGDGDGSADDAEAAAGDGQETTSTTTVDEPTGAADPVSAVRDYLDAMNADDCGRYVELVTEASLTTFDEAANRDDAVVACQEQVDGGTPLTRYDIVVQNVALATSDGTTATVDVTATVDGTTQTVQFEARNEDGWRVATPG